MKIFTEPPISKLKDHRSTLRSKIEILGIRSQDIWLPDFLERMIRLRKLLHKAWLRLLPLLFGDGSIYGVVAEFCGRETGVLRKEKKFSVFESLPFVGVAHFTGFWTWTQP